MRGVMSSTEAEALVARLWPGRTTTIVPLEGGITNRNYVVTVGGERLVLRIAGKDTGLLGIDRRHEEAADTLRSRGL